MQRRIPSRDVGWKGWVLYRASMRVVLAALVASLGACATESELLPASGHTSAIGRRSLAVESRSGVTVTADGSVRDGSPKNLPTAVTPVWVTLHNATGRSLRIQYDEFILRGASARFTSRSRPTFCAPPCRDQSSRFRTAAISTSSTSQRTSPPFTLGCRSGRGPFPTARPSTRSRGGQACPPPACSIAHCRRACWRTPGSRVASYISRRSTYGRIGRPSLPACKSRHERGSRHVSSRRSTFRSVGSIRRPPKDSPCHRAARARLDERARWSRAPPGIVPEREAADGGGYKRVQHPRTVN